MINQEQTSLSTSQRRIKLGVELGGFALVAVLVAGSAIVTKEATARSGLDPLAAVSQRPSVATESDSERAAVELAGALGSPTADLDAAIIDPLTPATDAPAIPSNAVATTVEPESIDEEPVAGPTLHSSEIRFFNGRPVRPARTIRMTVTAYSPDYRSCGDSADGITSSIHNVWTNGMRLVAADSRVLPLGSIITVPGYDADRVVPVLDRGGAIKGKRLDVLYATHEQALKWGVQKLDVIVWEYADGLPADDFRAIRDSRD